MGALPHHAVSTPASAPLSDRQQETLECPFRDAEALLWSRVCLWSCPDATLAACALQTTCEHRRDAAPCVARCFDDGIEERGKQRCGRNHGLLPPLLLFPHREGRRAVPHGTGSSTHKKTPTWNGRGRHIHTAAPFPRKDVSAPCRAGLLTRGISLLSAPSQGDSPQWSLQISFRSQLRGSDGFAPSSLVTVSDCDQPYQRHIQFWRGAYGSILRFVKDISGGIGSEKKIYPNECKPAIIAPGRGAERVGLHGSCHPSGDTTASPGCLCKPSHDGSNLKCR